MSSWSRREVLWALASAASAPLLGACGAGLVDTTPRAPLAGSDLEQRLRALAAELAAEYPDVTLSFRSEERARAWRTSDAQSLERDERVSVRLGAGDGPGRRELTVTDVTELGLELAAVDLRRALGTGSPRRAAIPGAPTPVVPDRSAQLEGGGERRGAPPKELLSEVDDETLRAPADTLYTSLAALPSSQVIRRVAQLDAVEVQHLFIADGAWRRARTRHVQTQATLMAWTGSVPATASLARESPRGALATSIGGADVERLHDWALTMLTSREVPVEDTRVVLDPLTAAALIGACVAPCLDGARWQSGGGALAMGQTLGSELVTLRDDPAGDFGGLAFDDSGQTARPATLIRAGVIQAALGARGSARARRRYTSDGTWTGCPTHLVARPGGRALGELITATGDGILIDGPVSGHVDPSTLSFGLVACRGQQIRSGTLSGRLYGTLELHGRLDELLQHIEAIGRSTASLPMHVDALHPMLVSAPAVLTRAAVRPA